MFDAGSLWMVGTDIAPCLGVVRLGHALSSRYLRLGPGRRARKAMIILDRGDSRENAGPNGRPRRPPHLDVNQGGTVGGSHQSLYDLVRSLDRSRYQPILRLGRDEDGKRCFLAYVKEIEGDARPH